MVMNTRTEKLADLVTTIKQRNRKCDKADKLKQRTSRDFADVQAAIAEEEKVSYSIYYFSTAIKNIS